MRVELDESARDKDSVPVSPIRLEDRNNVVREELDVSACAMDVAPVSPI